MTRILGTHLRPLTAVMFVLFACGCTGSSTDRSASSAASAASGSAAGGASGTTVKLDLDKIFPPGKGRELVLANCQNCHTFAPIVVLQKDKDSWYRNSL